VEHAARFEQPVASPFDTSTIPIVRVLQDYAKCRPATTAYQVWDISSPGIDAQDVVLLPALAERRVGVPEPALRVGRGHERPARLHRRRRPRLGVARDRCAASALFDISDISNPKYLVERADVPRLRPHPHTVVIDPNDASNVYVYVSGSAPVRSPTGVPGCVRSAPSNP